MRKSIYILIFTLLHSFAAFSQLNDAENYNEVWEFEIGDVIMLNQPTEGSKYQSAFYTFQAAKNIFPDLQEESYEPIPLSDQFKNASFTIIDIVDSIAMMSYGNVESFARLDLLEGLSSGEVGDRTRVSPVYEFSKAKKGDIILLDSAQGDQAYESVSFHHNVVYRLTDGASLDPIPLPASFVGTPLRVTKGSKKGLSILGNDSTREYALADLRLGLELGEIQINPGEETIASIPDSLQLSDTVERESIFKRIGYFPFLFPMLEFAPESRASLSVGGGIGVYIKNKWVVGAFIQRFDGNFNERIIFPNQFELDHTSAGLFAGYQLFSKNRVRIFGEAKIGYGEAAWTLVESGETLDADEFFSINPRISLDYQLNAFAILNITAGYNIINDLEMLNLESSDLSTFNFSAALKLGWFK